MKINNKINSQTSSQGWTAFTTTVTATTTSPTYGAGSVIKSYYLQQGKVLFVTLSITAVNGSGSNGSGVYLFNLPSGFTMNTSIVSFPNSDFAIGSATAYVQGNGDNGTGIAIAYDSTHYALFLFSSQAFTSSFVSNIWFQSFAGSNLALYWTKNDLMQKTR